MNMVKKKLETVTLLGIDCINLERLKLAMDICQSHFEFAEVKILSSIETNRSVNVIKINSINSLEKYSHFVINELNNYISTERVLIVQYDGFILNPEAWTDEFLKYDYIGAPWLVSDWSVNNFNFPVDLPNQLVVGNGGFSLRSKKMIELTSKLAREGKLEKYSPEDVAICVYYRKIFEQNGIKFAPVKLAQQFSFESEGINNYAWNNQFGFHGLKWTDISNWTKKNPQYKIDNPAADEAERKKYLE